MIGVVRNESLAGKIIQGAWLHNDKLRNAGYAILKNQSYKCYACGIQSKPSAAYRDAMMIPVNLKHAGLAATSEKGGVCYCPLCAAAAATNWSVVGTVTDDVANIAPGFLVCFPGKSQAEVSRLALFTLINMQRSNDSPLFSAATDIDVTMRRLAGEVAQHIPIYRKEGGDAAFVKALARIPDQFYEKRVQIIGPLRWWPNMSFWEPFGKYIYAATVRDHEDKIGLEKKLRAFLPEQGEGER